ncbi:MAG: FKBP-type peptidyl-prolyl cis-trans isomerase [Bdellovibrionia bacterium]
MQAQIISFHCILTDKVGKVISSTFNRDVITQGQSGILKGLSDGLLNLQAGEKRRITLSASDAYGYYNLSLLMEVSRSRFPKGDKLVTGDRVLVPIKGGEVRAYRVVQAGSKMLNLDGNHPLAGHDLTFEVEGIQSREATSEELLESCPEIHGHYYN